MASNPADRAEMYEDFKAVVGVKSATTLLEELTSIHARFDVIDAKFDLVDERFRSVDRRFDMLDQRFNSLESQLGNIHNWLRVMVIGFLGFATTVVATILRMN